MLVLHEAASNRFETVVSTSLCGRGMQGAFRFGPSDIGRVLRFGSGAASILGAGTPLVPCRMSAKQLQYRSLQCRIRCLRSAIPARSEDVSREGLPPMARTSAGFSRGVPWSRPLASTRGSRGLDFPDGPVEFELSKGRRFGTPPAPRRSSSRARTRRLRARSCRPRRPPAPGALLAGARPSGSTLRIGAQRSIPSKQGHDLRTRNC